MKYIFTIHSPITYFSACNIILQESIPHKDVILLIDGYNPPFIIGKIVESYQVKDKRWNQKFKNINLVKAYDQYIKKITNNDDFIAYIDLIHAYQRIIITNPKCVSFNFMEEGTASYVVPNNLQFLTKGAKQVGFRNKSFKQLLISLFRVLRGVNIRLLSLPFSPQAYENLNNIRFYTFSKDGYPGIHASKKVILNPNNIQNAFLDQFNDELKYSNSWIWVEESLNTASKNLGFTLENYNNAIKIVTEFLKEKKVEKIFLKTRPKRKLSESHLYSLLKQEEFIIEMIPDNMIAELIFIKSENIKVVGLNSSLLFYASIWGHESLSYYDLIIDKKINPFDEMDFYWNAVKMIPQPTVES